MKRKNTQNPLTSFYIAGLCLISLCVGVYLQSQYSFLKKSSENRDIKKSVSHVNSDQLNDICNVSFDLPNNYSLSSSNDSFYGLTFKDGEGKVCTIINGPNYKSGYEGFSGEQIQVNAYQKNLVTPQQLLSELLPQTTTFLYVEDYIELDNYRATPRTINAYRVTANGYGGTDESLIFERGNVTYQIIWRNNPNDVENVVKNLVKQIE